MTRDKTSAKEWQAPSLPEASRSEGALPALWVDMRENPRRIEEREEVFGLVGCIKMGEAAIARLAGLLQDAPWLCGVEDRARGYSPLRICSAMGHWACLEVMERHAHPLDWQRASSVGDTALILAARNNDVKCAQILAPKSNLLAVDIWGRSAAMSAAYLGFQEVLAIVIHGSNPLCIDEDGLDLLGCAAGSGVVECCDLVLNKLGEEHPAELMERACRGALRARSVNHPLVAARIEEMSLALQERSELEAQRGQAGKTNRAQRI